MASAPTSAADKGVDVAYIQRVAEATRGEFNFREAMDQMSVPQRGMCRGFLLFFLALITVIFSFVSLFTDVYDYDASSVHIRISYNRMTVCPRDVEGPSGATESVLKCHEGPPADLLCRPIVDRLSVAEAFAIILILASIAQLIMIIVEALADVLDPVVTYRVQLGLFVGLLIQWAVLTNAYMADKCKDTSLKSLGLKYEAAWILPFVAWLLTLFALPYLTYVEWTAKRALRV